MVSGRGLGDWLCEAGENGARTATHRSLPLCLLQGIQEDCASFLSWPWFGWALQVAVLGALAWAVTSANVHNYKLSIWAISSVVIFTSCYTAQKLYTMSPYSTGTLHDRQLVAFWGFILVIAGDYLMAITLDAV